MSSKRPRDLEPAMLSAVEELKGLVRARYPDATFEVGPGEDNPGACTWWRLWMSMIPTRCSI